MIRGIFKRRPHADSRDGGPPHIDTSAFFAPGSWRGELMPAEELMDAEQFERRGVRMPLRVYNARRLDPPATLASHGFQLARTTTPDTRRMSPAQTDETYAGEARALVESLTGCRETRLLNLRHRNGFGGLAPGDPRGTKPSPGVGDASTYEQLAHTDLTPWLERQPEWNDFVRDRHSAVYNVWRSTDVGGSIQQMPLAVCRARSILREDMIPACTYAVLPSGAGFVTYNLAHSPFQHWFYFPAMDHNEVLIFRLYDTREPDRRRRGVFHMAVGDPTSPPDAPPRQSVDMRIGALFEPETEREARRERFWAELPQVPESIHLRLGS